MKSVVRLKDASAEVEVRAQRKAKDTEKKEKKEKKARVFADLSNKEKDDLLKELAIRAGLVTE